MTDPIEPVSHQTPEEQDFDTTLTDEQKSTLTAEDIATKKADFYKDLYKKARKETPVKPVVPPVTPQAPTDFEKRLTDQEQKVELRLAGNTVEQIREIERYAKGAGISMTEAAKSPFVISAIESMKKVQEAKDATMEPSPRTVMVGTKTAKDILNDPKSSAADKAIRLGRNE